MSVAVEPQQKTAEQIDYELFLRKKRILAPVAGFDVAPHTLNPMLFPFQRDIVRWALRRGRAAIFADCGLGKTPMQLEWARRVHEYTGQNVLIVAPLAVSQQTAREGQKFNVHVTVCRTQSDVRKGVNITNYEMLQHFTPDFAGIVLDESSILKSYDGVIRKQITDYARSIPYRLACTATPAPNDLQELCNHSEFLDIMSGKEVIALFFTQDGNQSARFRLKGHARNEFWRWMASWSVAMRKPSDLGYEDDGFILPPLNIHQETVAAPDAPSNALMAVEALTMDERRAARRDSLPDRVKLCADMVNASAEPWLVWCNLNAESDALARAIPDAVEVRGSDTHERKTQALLDFSAGKIRCMVTKPTIAGFGMNWQHCANVAFVGLSDSYEQFYQAIRRCWRFGQTRPVECHVITAETEGAVVRNIQRKERQATEMFDNIVEHMAGLSLEKSEREEMVYEEDRETGRGWTLYLGDSIMRLQHVPTGSIGLSVFSPPFPGMYAYTNSTHDIGNTKGLADMIAQYKFLIPHLYRVTMPGRSACVHLTQMATFKHMDGFAGLRDFRGAVIDAMTAEGWIYYGEVTIDKNPQMKAIRTKDHGLLFKSLAQDSSAMHMAMADYLLQFKKPGENPIPIRAGISQKYGNLDGWITNEEWIRWARPVWYGADWHPDGADFIHEGDVLNVSQARETDDERHLCPLQLGVIERAIKLWSAPGETVLDPFAGIGSTGYMALKLNREFVGVELKRSYYLQAIRNLRKMERDTRPMDLFSVEDD